MSGVVLEIVGVARVAGVVGVIGLIVSNKKNYTNLLLTGFTNVSTVCRYVAQSTHVICVKVS